MRTTKSLIAAFVSLLLLAPLAAAQSPLPFTNIILVIQENRTPDNLFGDPNCGLASLGADVQPFGQGVPLARGSDFAHGYSDFKEDTQGNWPTETQQYILAETIAPYCQMAQQFGFANYMFQTHRGPSFPAHQFLISGTSAPDDLSPLFVDGNPVRGQYNGDCASNGEAPTLNAEGKNGGDVPTCFDRSSLLDLIENAGLTWRYYAADNRTTWDAPAALANYAGSPNNVLNPPQVLADIANGNLANVSWVTPSGLYSDHPGDNDGAGPAWVASIVNAVGSSPYWQNTAILVTWDEWGGFYDHVPPPQNSTGWCIAYCYGFRVPLLVISAYTPAGYVDNGTHDFGSILNFVESNFGLGFIGPGGWADSFADNLSGFFQSSEAARKFQPIRTRALTRKELEDQSDPDSE